MAPARMILNDRSVQALPAALEKNYSVRDEDLRGFFLIVGKNRKTYMVDGAIRKNGKRVAQVKMSLGDVRNTSAARARRKAKSCLGKIADGIHPDPEKQRLLEGYDPVANSITLNEAWERYLQVHLLRKRRSAKTIHNYRDHVERLLKEWRNTPILKLGKNPGLIAQKHDKISRMHGPYQANHAMRTLRAVYNHARKTNRDLPAYNPVDAIDWNPEERRSSGMGLDDLAGWFEQLIAISNPIRREYHWFTLLSGCRPDALKKVKIGDFKPDKRILHIAKPKGGTTKAFDIPLSDQMMKSIIRAIRLGEMLNPSNDDWIFPAESQSGHLETQKEHRHVLAKWGNDLRQSYRTMAAVAGISEMDAKLLMNHALPGVNSGYITRHKLLEDHLRNQQQRITDVIMAEIVASDACKTAVKAWFRPSRHFLSDLQ